MHGILERARNSISSFCIEECKAFCCRKGYLVLTKEQVPLVAKGAAVKILENGKSSLQLPCPSLENNKCSIYNHPLRPSACREFPIFSEGEIVRFSPHCLAVKENKFYPYIKELLAKGAIVVEPNEGFTEIPELR